jgi:hypothetical protein
LAKKNEILYIYSIGNPATSFNSIKITGTDFIASAQGQEIISQLTILIFGAGNL